MRNNSRKKVIIADDHVMFREGAVNLLVEHFDVVGQTDNGHDAIRLARQLEPDIAILDFSMPLLNGIDAAREIHRRTPDTLTLLLTMYDDDSRVQDALKAGVRGYVLKTQTASELIIAIKELIKGQVYLSPGISDAVVKAYITRSYPERELLSERERQVLQLIAEGHTTKSIASMLFVSVKTAESHRTHIMQRLDLHNVAGLVRYAIRSGMIRA